MDEIRQYFSGFLNYFFYKLSLSAFHDLQKPISPRVRFRVRPLCVRTPYTSVTHSAVTTRYYSVIAPLLSDLFTATVRHGCIPESLCDCQGRIYDFRKGGHKTIEQMHMMRARSAWCARTARAAARGVWGHAPPPGIFLSFRRSENDSGAFWNICGTSA